MNEPLTIQVACVLFNGIEFHQRLEQGFKVYKTSKRKFRDKEVGELWSTLIRIY